MVVIIQLPRIYCVYMNLLCLLYEEQASMLNFRIARSLPK